MKKLIIFLMILSVNFYSYANDHDIKVQVGNEVITKLDIDNRTKIINSFGSDLPIDEKSKQKLKETIINSLIEEKLITKEFKRLKLKLEDDEVNFYISNIEKSNGAKAGSFLAEIRSKNIPENSAIDYIRARIIFSKIINYAIRPTIQVSEKEFEEVLASIIPENAVVDFKQIIINPETIANEDQYNKSLEKLNNLRHEIKKCDEVDMLAAKAKIEVTNISLSINNLHPELQNIIRILPIGKASAIIKSSSGPQIIVVCKRDYSGLNNEEKEEIREALTQKKIETQVTHYINKLRHKTFVEIIR
jgi:peptidyl-prolyl cis-trans isomerase SurA